MSELIPGIAIKILAGNNFGDEIWVTHLIHDVEIPHLDNKGRWLFHAFNENIQSETGPTPMVVEPERILVQYQHEETGRVVERKLNSPPGDRYYIISFPWEICRGCGDNLERKATIRGLCKKCAEETYID